MTTATIAELDGAVTASRAALFEMDDGAGSVSIALADLERSMAQRVNPKDYTTGTYVFGSGDATADTAAILAAWVVAAAMSPIAVMEFPPIQCGLNATWQINASRAVIIGEGAVIKTFGAGLVQIGDASHLTVETEIRGVTFLPDSAATADAPLFLKNAGRVYLTDGKWLSANKNCITLEVGNIVGDNCKPAIAPTASPGSVVNVTTGATQSSSIQFTGGVMSGKRNGGQYAFTFAGAGHLDGIRTVAVNFADYSGHTDCRVASGGNFTNFQVYGCELDQMSGKAFNIKPASGASLGDMDIVGNTINGASDDVTSTGALISLDLTSGATAAASNIRVADNAFKDARSRIMEVVGGTLKSVIFRDNVASDYGRVNDGTGRVLYIAGTIDALDITNNHCRTSFTHDYDVEFGTVTIAGSREEGNTFRGTAAARSSFNNYSFRSIRTRLTATKTFFVRTDGSDTNTGLVNDAAGAFLTLQGAWDKGVAPLDLNGQQANIKFADGTYTGGLNATNGPVGSGVVQIQGNSSTPGNVIISTTSADCIRLASAMNCVTYVRDMQLQTTTGGYCLNSQARAQLQFGNIIFGAAASGHIIAQATGAFVNAVTNYTISSGTLSHAIANYAGVVLLTGRTIILTGTPAFTTFATANVNAIVRADSMTFTGAATGTRYSAAGCGVIHTAGAAATYLPGSASGTTSTGGQYT